jgi:hypothetical protein
VTQISFSLTPAMVDAMLGVLLLTVADIALGIIGAIAKGEFDFGKLPSFLRQTVLPYVGGLLILGVVATAGGLKVGDTDVSGALVALYFASAAFVAAKLLKDVAAKVAGLVGRGESF